MAGRRLVGEAFAGEVTDVVMTYSEGKRPSPRPLVTVRTDDRPHLGERTKVYRSLGGKPQAAEFAGYEGSAEGDGLVVLRIVDKMGRGKEPEAGSVPEKGTASASRSSSTSNAAARSCPTRRRPRGRTAARRATPTPYRCRTR